MFERLREAIDELESLDPTVLASMEDTLALATLFDRLEAVSARAFAVFDARGSWLRCPEATGEKVLRGALHQPDSADKGD